MTAELCPLSLDGRGDRRRPELVEGVRVIPSIIHNSQSGPPDGPHRAGPGDPDQHAGKQYRGQGEQEGGQVGLGLVADEARQPGPDGISQGHPRLLAEPRAVTQGERYDHGVAVAVGPGVSTSAP